MQPPIAVAQPIPGQQEQAVAYGQPVQAIPMAMAQPVVGQPVMAQPAAAQYQQAQHPQTFIFQQQQQQQPSAMEIHYHHPDGRRDDDDPTCGWILFVMGLIFTPLFCCLGACATSGDQRGPRVRQAFRFNCFGSVFCSAVFLLWIIIAVASSTADAGAPPPPSTYVARYAPNPPPPQPSTEFAPPPLPPPPLPPPPLPPPDEAGSGSTTR